MRSRDQRSPCLMSLTRSEPRVQAAWSALHSELSLIARDKLQEIEDIRAMSDHLLALSLQEGFNDPEEFPELSGKKEDDDFTVVGKKRR